MPWQCVLGVVAHGWNIIGILALLPAVWLVVVGRARCWVLGEQACRLRVVVVLLPALVMVALVVWVWVGVWWLFEKLIVDASIWMPCT